MGARNLRAFGNYPFKSLLISSDRDREAREGTIFKISSSVTLKAVEQGSLVFVRKSSVSAIVRH